MKLKHSLMSGKWAHFWWHLNMWRTVVWKCSRWSRNGIFLEKLREGLLTQVRNPENAWQGSDVIHFLILWPCTSDKNVRVEMLCYSLERKWNEAGYHRFTHFHTHTVDQRGPQNTHRHSACNHQRAPEICGPCTASETPSPNFVSKLLLPQSLFHDWALAHSRSFVFELNVQPLVHPTLWSKRVVPEKD